jgi:hypothetical protein
MDLVAVGGRFTTDMQHKIPYVCVGQNLLADPGVAIIGYQLPIARTMGTLNTTLLNELPVVDVEDRSQTECCRRIDADCQVC